MNVDERPRAVFGCGRLTPLGDFEARVGLPSASVRTTHQRPRYNRPPHMQGLMGT